MSTLASLGATLRTSVNSCFILSLRATMSSSDAWSCSSDRRRRFSAARASFSVALSSTASSSIASMGFSMKPNAPSFIASTTLGTLP